LCNGWWWEISSSSILSITIVPSGYLIEASDTIGSEGGKIEITESAASLYGIKASIPKNALSKNVTITISKIEEYPPFPDQYIGIGLPVDFGPSIKFNSPVTITIPYDLRELEEREIYPDDLRIYFFDISKSEWLPVENTIVDTQDQTISANVTHFSLFRTGYKRTEAPQIEFIGKGCFVNTLMHNPEWMI